MNEKIIKKVNKQYIADKIIGWYLKIQFIFAVSFFVINIILAHILGIFDIVSIFLIVLLIANIIMVVMTYATLSVFLKDDKLSCPSCMKDKIDDEYIEKQAINISSRYFNICLIMAFLIAIVILIGDILEMPILTNISKVAMILGIFSILFIYLLEMAKLAKKAKEDLNESYDNLKEESK